MYDLPLYIVSFIAGLGAIVFVHELGHHLVAKLCGVRVVTFSLGFGKRLWGFQHKGTDYRVSAVPLGGYVRMGGELPDEHTGHPNEFLSKPRWQRILVYLAGPAMNVVLSIAVIAAVFMAGFEVQALQGLPPVLGLVEEGSAGEAAGLRPGDRIVKIDGEEVDEWKEVHFVFMTSPERAIPVEYERAGERATTEVTPRKEPVHEYGEAGLYPELQLRISEVISGTPAAEAGFEPGDEPRAFDGSPVTDSQQLIEHLQSHAGVEVTIDVLRGDEIVTIPVTPALDPADGKGKIGVKLAHFRPLPFGEAVVESFNYNVEIVVNTGRILAKLFTREISAKSSLSGPIQIADISGQAAKEGFKEWIFMVGFLSISIGLMNLLPIPILDGGHITILLIESVMRRDMSMLVKERITQVGFMMLMTLMAVVIYFDLAKKFPSLLPGS